MDVENKAVPELNKTYNCFDDGKISKSRLYTVKVHEVVSISDIDDETKKEWIRVKTQCPWTYNATTDFFIKITEGEEGGDGVFVRANDGGWFGMGEFMNSGRLDIDGTLTKLL